MSTWWLEIQIQDEMVDPEGLALEQLCSDPVDRDVRIRTSDLYEVAGAIPPEAAERMMADCFADPVLHTTRLAEGTPLEIPDGCRALAVHRLPGVMDPVLASARRGLRLLDIPAQTIRRARVVYLRGPVTDTLLDRVRREIFNPVIETVRTDSLSFPPVPESRQAAARRTEIPLLEEGRAALETLATELSLSPAEVRTIGDHFTDRGRNPTDVELETIAQTWSEHCKHKTLTGGITIGNRQYDNLLKETIFHATRELDLPYCRSVFVDNAGVIGLTEDWDVCFKVETHNHPSAIEPYGGAETGVGGVIRDILGTGLGARPVMNTDVFCFAPPDLDPSRLPEGVLGPRRHLLGVVAGVRDYGNRMGIPTANGAICFDERYAANPLVYCGTVGILPRGAHEKKVHPGDRIVVVGGRTGRDGIHGATFSSRELDAESEAMSGGSVQIGNPITEKKLVDVLLPARDAGEFTAITDCGAGGLSSAVGEMGEKTGAEVFLERVPLKYAGLTPAEIWISEAQERMVCAVPSGKLDDFLQRCERAEVEATEIGSFTGDRRLRIRHGDVEVCDLSMTFLHDGLPPVERTIDWAPPPVTPVRLPENERYDDDLLACLSDWNVCSREWVVRQYDHEVQGTSVIKPFCGPERDGPTDGAVVAPLFDSEVGLAVGCGIHPWSGDVDPYAMALAVVDEALRNVVSVGGDPSHAALLDNFSWGDVHDDEILGALVRAVEGCRDAALGFGVPFISGKDSLHNAYRTPEGERLSIPGTLLVSALARVPSIRRAQTIDLKGPDHPVHLIGVTDATLAGSRILQHLNKEGGQPPKVDLPRAKRILAAVHEAMQQGLLLACHDLSDGGLAVAAAEMAFAGDIGLTLDLDSVPVEEEDLVDPLRLFAESPTRFLVEVDPDREAEFERQMEGLPTARLGTTTANATLRFHRHGTTRIDRPLSALKKAWKSPLPRAFGGG